MNFETIVFWIPQTTRVNIGGRCANILKMTPVAPRGGLRMSTRSPCTPTRSPNGPRRRKQLTRCRIKHELTDGSLKGIHPFAIVVRCFTKDFEDCWILNIMSVAYKGTGMWLCLWCEKFQLNRSYGWNLSSGFFFI